MREQQLLEAGQKLAGLITNLLHETDYLPDFYYEWMRQVLSETDEILSDEIDIALIPNGGVYKEEHFQPFVYSELDLYLSIGAHKEQEEIASIQFLEMIQKFHPEVLQDFIKEHYDKPI